MYYNEDVTRHFIINTNMHRELNERSLVNCYARLVYEDESDTSEYDKIIANLDTILDWDKSGELGLGIYCSRFEKIKKADIAGLVQFIIDHAYEIKELSYAPKKRKREEIYKAMNLGKIRATERLKDPNYKTSNRGIKARTCIYEGREYKSRQECIAKEGISNFKLYEYLKKTGQV